MALEQGRVKRSEQGFEALQATGRFGFEPDQTYPDFHSNYETFTNEDMLELESLSPLVRLAPGDIVEHTERWELVPNVPEGNTEAELVETVLPLLLPG